MERGLGWDTPPLGFITIIHECYRLVTTTAAKSPLQGQFVWGFTYFRKTFVVAPLGDRVHRTCAAVTEDANLSAHE